MDWWPKVCPYCGLKTHKREGGHTVVANGHWSIERERPPVHVFLCGDLVVLGTYPRSKGR